MRILGIDPGFDRLGVAVVEGNPSKPTLVWSECVEPKKGAMSERLATVFTAVTNTIEKFKPDALSIETLFFNTNQKTAITVAQARGAVLTAAGAKNLAVIEFSPQQVKIAVTGYGASDKTAVARMLPKLLSLPEKRRRDDEIDAIAVALAGLSTQGR